MSSRVAACLSLSSAYAHLLRCQVDSQPLYYYQGAIEALQAFVTNAGHQHKQWLVWNSRNWAPDPSGHRGVRRENGWFHKDATQWTVPADQPRASQDLQPCLRDRRRWQHGACRVQHAALPRPDAQHSSRQAAALLLSCQPLQSSGLQPIAAGHVLGGRRRGVSGGQQPHDRLAHRPARTAATTKSNTAVGPNIKRALENRSTTAAWVCLPLVHLESQTLLRSDA